MTLAATATQAHELSCDKTVNGQHVIEVSAFPTDLQYVLTITNTHPTLPSDVLSATDTMWPVQQTFPFTLAVGESWVMQVGWHLTSYVECKRVAATLGGVDTLDNIFTVTWDQGQASCEARVVCVPEVCTRDCTPPGGATRTMGFFKNRESALSQCLAQGSINLGFITISTLPSALGLLWGSPAKYSDGDHRSTIDATRFRLARQTMVGICNHRLFGTDPTPASLLTDAVAALAGTSCSNMDTLEGQVDAFNNSGDAIAFPAGFDPGAADPQHASDIAVDPTSASSDSCF
ncbi:MAG: hypothetical protein ACXWLM_02365 [Myxococcales bacterium]